MSLKKRVVLCLMLLFATWQGKAQYGNEWIRPWQPYFKFKIVNTGIYRIDASTLTQSGLNLSGLNPKKLQLFRNGVELAVYVHGEEDNTMDPGDYIEFYGERNDGKLDQELYKPGDQPHTWFSLISDTSVYFLTVLADTSSQSGKRLTPYISTNFGGLTPEAFVLNEVKVFPTNQYSEGISLAGYLQKKYESSEYTDGEGWASPKIGLGGQFVTAAPLSTPFLYTGSSPAAIAPEAEMKVIGASDAPDVFQGPLVDNHHIMISLSPDNSTFTPIWDQKYKGYSSRKNTTTVSPSLIGSSTFVRMNVVNDLNAASDYNQLSYVRLTYSRETKLGGSTSHAFRLLNLSAQTGTFLDFQNYGSGSATAPVFYDFTTNTRITGVYQAGNARTVIPNDHVPHELYLFDSADASPVVSLTPVTFPAIDPAQNYEFILISNPALNPAASDYANYRSIKYKVLKVYSHELYDAYTYGNVHPLAVRRFAKHLIQQSSQKPKYLLLAGRGYQTDLIRGNAAHFVNNLVPSIGVPSSDVMFTAGITGSGYEADIPTGRVAAATAQELRNYLDKLIEYEDATAPRQEWQKHVLHVSGGDEQGLQQQFVGIMNGLKAKITGPFWGSRVSSYYKTTSDPTQVNLRQTLINHLNDGTSMLTFIGHASATILDVDIGSISDLIPNHRYTFYYFNGCNVGNANDIDPNGAGNIYAKDYVCAQNKGAIGWLSHSNETNTGDLPRQMGDLYDKMVVSMYGSGIATIQQAAAKKMKDSFAGETMRSHCLQWLLQGDPAVPINSPALPDYKVSAGEGDVFTFPASVNNLIDSFAVGVSVTNLGKATSDTVNVSITRVLPNLTRLTSLQDRFSRPVLYKDTMYFWMKSKGDPLAVGNNKFEITVDPLNAVQELTPPAKANNTTVFEKFIAGSGIQVLFPTEFSIVNADTVKLTVQNNDLFANNMGYLFEIDTIPLTSPVHSLFYRSSPTMSSGARASWQVVLPASDDSVVYFWRARLNLPPAAGGEFVYASFTHIRGGFPGWAQSRFEQYRRLGDNNGMVLNEGKQSLEFRGNGMPMTILNRRWNHNGTGIVDPYFASAGVFANCGYNYGMLVELFDSITLQPIVNPGYPMNCPGALAAGYYYYLFNTTDSTGRAEFRRWMDSVPVNTYMVALSRYDAGFPNWEQSTRDRLAQFGSVKAANARSFYTVIALAGRKGAAPGTATEDTIFNDKYNTPQAPDDSAKYLITLKPELTGKWYTGSMTSRPVGPVKKWGSLFFGFHQQEAGTHDRTTVDVILTDNKGIDTVYVKDAFSGYNLSSIDPAKYPSLKLRVTFFDSIRRTPDQFGYWMVTHDPVPEGTIDPETAFEFYAPELEQGDSLRIKVAFRNVSAVTFDSVPMEVRIIDASNVNRYTQNTTFPTLKPDSAFIFDSKIATTALSGKNQLTLAFNGKNVIPEITLVNNFLSRDFDVKVDRVNPLLDVTFDGYRIMNGDFVSPTPVIRITSKDENTYRLQNDTTTFQLLLSRPNSNTMEKVNMSSSQVRFTPGTSKDNKAMLEFTPDRLADGQYTLQVQSKDASGNFSGNNAYSIDFNVVNQSTITNFFPYPNPCTTNMKFVFTLTGSKPPDQLLIRIMTISGKIVREIGRQEFGPIKIGNNMSEWSWDGTDEYGDRLANGVYLYQVFTRIDGEEILHRDTKADKFLLQNTGKIYLMH